jgi:hypothetical protein
MKLTAGVQVEKHFDGHGICVGKLVKSEIVSSALYPNHDRPAWLVKYSMDGHEKHFEEEELRSAKHGPVNSGMDGKAVLLVRDLAERKAIVDALNPGFQYLENRLTGNCETNYSLISMYELCNVARAFDPTFAAVNVDASFVNSLSAITPLMAHGLLDGLKNELPQYIAAARTAQPIARDSVAGFTEAVLAWWRAHVSTLPAWSEAARIVFAISPNSASGERVFALLRNLFGEEQFRSLADYLQASLMLNYHRREVG